MKKYTNMILIYLSTSIFNSFRIVYCVPFVLLLGIFIMDSSCSYATTTTYTNYAVYGANTPVGPTTYCSGASPSYTCTDNETSCSNSYGGNTNTITWQWYYDAAIAISGASGSFTANGTGTTVTLSALPTLSAGSHTLYCTFTPNQSNCGYYSYAAITSPALTITVGSTPSPITGTATVCPGSTTPLSDPTPGGSWTSGITTIATVDNSGIVYGIAGGTSLISYAVGGTCPATLAVTVATLAHITGGTSVCVGSTTPLTDLTGGGIWSSSNTSAATVSVTGVVYGVATGSTTISYSQGGCTTTVAFTVGAAISPVTGPSAYCVGSTGTLSDGTGGGTWSTSNTGIATVTPSGTVTGVATGSANIIYSTGGCSISYPITVAGALTPITGTTSVCPGGTTPLSDATGGGSWTVVNPSVATVSSGGVVTGMTAGTTTVSYTVGTCSVGATITVITVAPITGTAAVCPGGTTQLSDATPGGTWTSTNMGIATITAGGGLVYGVTNGTANISYSALGCSVGIALTVSPLPAIVGPTNVCVGATIQLSEAIPGGVWSTGSAPVATVTATGVVTGVSSGSASIIYSLNGCSTNVLVNVGSAVPAITGNSTVCVGMTTHLSDATPGGIWSSGTTSVANVSNLGVVTGATTGTANISYTVGACSVTDIVTVQANSGGIITGKDSVCIGPGHTVTLSDDVSGGVWSSSISSRATVDPSTGVVTGVIPGIDTIKYTITNSCGTFVVKYVIHVRTGSICTTGISEPGEGEVNVLKVSPNPNDGTFTMTLVSDIDEDVHVVVTTIVGDKVKDFTTNTNKVVEIKLNPATGIYLLSATTSHGRYDTKIVVR